MTRLVRGVVGTFVNGVLFLVPIVLVAVLTREGYEALHRLFEPVARLLPRDRVIGILTEDLLTLVAIGLVFLAAGLFVATAPGRRLGDRLEQGVLYRVPGYLMVRGVVGRFPGQEVEGRPEPALWETGEGWGFVLVVERLAGGYCTIFVPEAPTPTSGDVLIVEAARVRSLDVSMLGLLSCLTRSGARAGALAARALEEIRAGGDPAEAGRL